MRNGGLSARLTDGPALGRRLGRYFNMIHAAYIEGA